MSRRRDLSYLESKAPYDIIFRARLWWAWRFDVQIKFLGTGAAEGVPAINCNCDHCTRARDEGGRLIRGRNAILFSLPGCELLLDTPPEIRALLSKNKDGAMLDLIVVGNLAYDDIITPFARRQRVFGGSVAREDQRL